MYSILGMLLAVWLILAGCTTTTTTATGALSPVAVSPSLPPADYLREVQPILNKRCVVCHSCYNSPCQLKLSSFEGVERGATKRAVYDARRLRTMDPTRLFVDAHSVDGWRNKGFTSVIDSDAANGFNNSLLLQLLDHKKKNPVSSGDYLPEADDLTCAANTGELGGFLAKHPNRGMPFGFPPLKEQEYRIIAGWLAGGAHGPLQEERDALAAIPSQDQESVGKWENFLNKTDPKHVMTARYLYEHFFLAHIGFGKGSGVFYELVRSRTPRGKELEIIPSIRPYDDPGGPFYYRFNRIQSTIVHKTHMVMRLGDEQLERIRELFIEPEWLLKPDPVGYDPEFSANPFAVFEQIPPRSRYQFLLDNAHFIIMTFIHGPVCKGQVALNVVNDHFWLMFLDPDHDLSILHPGFLKESESLLRMPSEKGSYQSLISAALIKKYRRAAAVFARKRQQFYDIYYRYQGRGYEAIWRGNRAEDAPLLTVFRHFDSASVHKGALGDLPKTLWVVDYPLLERIYYALVAGFDVFGAMGHQLATRTYMDELRQEGETQFLDFLPEDQRQSTMQYWYGGMNLRELDYFPSSLEETIEFSTVDAKREFVEYLVHHHFLPETGIQFDDNYLEYGEEPPTLPPEYTKTEDYLQGFRAVSAPGAALFTHIVDYNANLAYIRIRVPEKEDVVVSMVVHRWHDDVTTLHHEELNLDSSKDQADFFLGFIGSYPNYFFDVELKDLPDFLDLLKRYDGSRKSRERLAKYGVNRAEERFWDVYDWFQQRFNESDPELSGLFDLNRYYHKAR